MPWLMVNQTRLLALAAVPTPLLALDVHRGEIPGAPGGTIERPVMVVPCYCGFRTSARRSSGNPWTGTVHQKRRTGRQFGYIGLGHAQAIAGINDEFCDQRSCGTG